MHRSTLTMRAFRHESIPNTYRSVFKNRHGRTLFLSLALDGEWCTILECFYTDRNLGKAGAERRKARPLLLKTFEFEIDRLSDVIQEELDKNFCNIEFITDNTCELPLAEFVQFNITNGRVKYRFLIMVGSGNTINGLPAELRTRFKNKLHRAVYVKLNYYNDGNGVVSRCCYYDRPYKREGVTITPPTLTRCFFPYTREGILNLINHEICCDFTHIIIIDENEDIDPDNDTTPLCGSI